MSKFQLLDTNRYPLAVNNEVANLCFYQYEHRATVGYNCREFMVYVDHLKGQSYIEEITGGHLEKIEDDVLHDTLSNFALEKGLLALGPPPLRRLS